MGDVVQFRRSRLTGFLPEQIEPAKGDEEHRGLIAHARQGSPTIIMHDDEILHPCDTEPPGAA
jgi:hypothetical protein